MARSASLFLLFLIIPTLAKPQDVSLVYPSNGAVVSDTSVAFVWNIVQGNNITYQLQLTTDSLFAGTVLDTSGLTSNTLNVSALTLGNTYWWRIKYFNSSVPSGWSSTYNFRVFSPLAVPGIMVWLEPETGITQSGSQVQSWQSRVGTYTLSQASSTRMPNLTDTPLFARQGIRFDGIDDFIQGPFLNHQALTIIVMHHPRNKNSSLFSQARFTFTGFNWYINNSSRHTVGCLQTPANTSYTFSGKPYPFNIPANSFSIDGLAISNPGIRLFTGSSDTLTSQTISFLDIPSITNSRLGAMGNNSAYYDGVIYEVFIADTILDQSTYNNLYNYLLWKYQPPVNLGPDIHLSYTFCDTVLKAAHNYRSYLWSTGDTTATITTSTPGTYWLQVTDFLGRVSSDTTAIFSHLPASGLSDTTICLNEQITLDPGISGAYTFEWNNDPLLNTQTFTTSAAGIHTVIIKDSFNCQIADSVFITIDNYALTASLGPDRAACIGETLALASGAAQTVSYQWSTGINDTLSQIILQSGGTFSVTATNILGCSAVSQINISIKGAAPSALFNTSAKTICPKEPLTLIDFSSAALPFDPISAWQWDFGDGNAAFTQNTTHMFQAPGVYTIGLTVLTDSGCFAQAFDTVTVLPLSGINITHSNPCCKTPVSFQNTPSGAAPISHYWLFSYGGITKDTSSSLSPTYTWFSPGNYKVELIVASDQGCINHDSIIITVYQSPSAALSFSPLPACDGDAVTFSDNSIFNPSYPVDNWQWNFGDGSPVVQGLKSPTHTFPSPGTFPVSLIVANSFNGCTDTTIQNIVIGEMPQPLFNANNSFCTGQSDTLFGTTILLNDSVSEWLWETEPHGSIYSQNAALTFNETGTYAVTLSVKTSHGCHNSIVDSVHVFKTPDTKFLISKAFGNPPLTVQFYNQTTGADLYYWDFGDGQFSSLMNPINTFYQEDIFTVLLVATSDSGCSSEYSDVVYTLQPSIDLEMLRVDAEIFDGDQLKISAEFKNNSIFEIQRVDIIAWIIGGDPVVESWTAKDISDRLKPGNIKRYNFTSGFILTDELQGVKNVVCARVMIPEYAIDANPDNDEICAPFSKKFIVNNPFPNPASDILRLDIIIDIPDLLSISISNLQGQKVSSLYEEYLDEGLNSVIIPLPNSLKQGVYFLNIHYRDQVVVKKIVIIKSM